MVRAWGKAVAAVSLCLCGAASAVAQDGPGNGWGQCRAVPVQDEDERPVVGIEDMVLDRAGERLILSAYNRRAVEAARARGVQPPRGGLFTLALDALDADLLTAARLPVTGDGGFAWFPHGIGISETGGSRRLLVVNRVFDGEGDGQADGADADLLVLDLDDAGAAVMRRIQSGKLCRANDAEFAGGDTALVTVDHAACPLFDAWMERIFSRPRSGVLRVDLDTGTIDRVLDGIAYANGIEVDPVRGEVHVAASRGHEVITWSLAEVLAGEAKPLRRVTVPGGPDNLVLDEDGSLFTAAHPNLFALFLHMLDMRGIPGSTVVGILPDGTARTLLGADDALPGAATTALRAGDRLVVSSAWDKRIGICTRIGGAEE